MLWWFKYWTYLPFAFLSLPHFEPILSQKSKMDHSQLQSFMVQWHQLCLSKFCTDHDRPWKRLFLQQIPMLKDSLRQKKFQKQILELRSALLISAVLTSLLLKNSLTLELYTAGSINPSKFQFYQSKMQRRNLLAKRNQLSFLFINIFKYVCSNNCSRWITWTLYKCMVATYPCIAWHFCEISTGLQHVFANLKFQTCMHICIHFLCF